MSVVLEALEVARSQLGKHEEGGANKGEIVRQVASPFLSVRRFAEAYEAGKLRWCAFFVCWCVLQVLIQRNDKALTGRWMGGRRLPPRLASGECDSLWDNLTKEKDEAGNSWCWTHDGDGQLPQAGDLVFYGGWVEKDGEQVLDLTHVAFVDRVEGLVISTIGGNEGDRVKAQTYDLASPKGRRIYGFARIPWA